MTPNFLSIHHVSMIISNLEQSRYFYHEVLGLEIDDSRPDLAFAGLWLQVNESQQIHLLLVDNPDPQKRPEHGGRDRHAAFKVNDINQFGLRLKQHQITYRKSSSGRAAIFVRDPDGNTLELME